jgi:hypothetical protein
MDMAHNQINEPPTLAEFDYRGIDRAVAERIFLAAPDALLFSAHGAVCAIAARTPHDPAAALLAQRLADDGWRPVLLAVPDWGEAALAAALAGLAAAHGPVGTFVSIDANSAADAGDKAWVRWNFLAAKHMRAQFTASAAAAQPPERRIFLTVTRLDGAFGLHDCARPIIGGLFGLAKTLHLEWDDVFARAVDCAPALSPEAVVSAVAAEMRDADRLLAETAFDHDGRRSTLTARLAGHTADAVDAHAPAYARERA